MIEIRRAADRGVAEHGWLSSRHTFSFAQYFDPEQVGFSDLLVINDDRVAAGRGFGRHPHRDMEIFSYVLEGALEHRDSMGNGSTIVPGDVQLMSAGSGVAHSEYNPSASDPVHFLQIWILPSDASLGATPRYQQMHVEAQEKRGKLRLMLSPEGEGGALAVRQDVRVYAAQLTGDETASLELSDDRYAYVHVAQGEVTVNGIALGAGDGLKLRDESALKLTEGRDAHVLVFDLRARETPPMR
ncbi:pirin family protein [Trinickia diaoshuihuensis]|uniref:pirin family protein n=1 Tax=Trinickia diaoshuihuensis TaxID=2292265 RepID=UPI000E24B36C|nr:pirin family protein [Trinickia diaoshuihuensis]